MDEETRTEYSGEQKNEGDPGLGETDVDYDEVRESAREMFETDYEFVLQSETDFTKIFRFNFLLLTGIGTVAAYAIGSFNIPVSRVLNVHIYAAVVFWIASTGSIALSYVGIWFVLPSMILSPSEQINTHNYPAHDEPSDSFPPIHADDNPLVPSERDEQETSHDRLVADAYVRATAHNQLEATYFRYPLYHAGLTLMLVSVSVFLLGLLIAYRRSGLLTVEGVLSGALILFGSTICLGVVREAVQRRERLLTKFKNLLGLP